MFIQDNLKINSKNHLEIGGMDAVELAREYGTPLYVMDENKIRSNARVYKNAIQKYYDGKGLILYASKAFSAMYIYRIMFEEGLGVDVVSGGELYTALKAGMDASKIYFHGNNKTYEELKMAVENSVGRIVVDNIFELEMLNEISKNNNVTTKILFRIKPGVEAHTHEFVCTGQIDSKFGVALETGEAFNIVQRASKLSNVEVVGIHCHIGSQIMEVEPFKLAAEVMLGFAAEIKTKLKVVISELNLGGGFGIKYLGDDKPVSYDKYIETVSKVVKKVCSEKGLDLPTVIMEPGRSIVGDAGITLYTIGGIKDIPNVRKYAAVDGGMADNPRYIMYKSVYDGILANRANENPDDTVTICGKCCESGDIIIKDALLPKVNTGDILAVMSTGAYNYSMASNYNRIPRPSVIMASDGKAKVVVKRETYEDIIKNDLI